MSSFIKEKRNYLICAAAVIVLLCIAFIVISHTKKQMPVYELELDGLSAQNASLAQAECRTDYERFAALSEQYGECSWVWCGNSRMYLVKNSTLRITETDTDENFTAVKFTDSSGEKLTGYLIDPTIQPKELGRIELTDGEEYDFESVSMSIRVGIRDDEISYENAVYLWEKDSSQVLVVRQDTYELVQDNIVTFTDDGNTVHTCYILDTEI